MRYCNANVRFWHLADIQVALHMSAFGGKADMTFCGNSLLRSLFGGKRTYLLRCKCLLLTQSGHPANGAKPDLPRIKHRREPAIGERHAATWWKRTTGQGAAQEWPKARKAPIAHVSNADLQEQLGRAMRERDEALERQAATFEVLQVISASPGKLEPVFQAMLENALRICEAKFGTLFRFDGKAFHRAAEIGVPSALAELQEKRGPYLPESGTLLDRVLQTREVAHSPDYAAEPIPGNAAKLGGARSTVAVPMLKDSELVGAIIIYRQEVRPSPTNRSNSSRTLPPKPLSPSKTRDCSASCISALTT